ncbi:nucleotide-binding domain-containing protein [Gottfriedia acidiceleris]
MAEFTTTTNLHEFHCDYYVVCYIVKNGECVARDRIPVTIY